MKSAVLNEMSFMELVTPGGLRKLGMGEVAYVRAYAMDGRTAFVVHAADGAAVSVQKDLPAARTAARLHELELVSLH